MTQELIDSVNTLTGEATKLLDEYVQAKTTIDAKVDQASNSATASTAQAGISATKAAEAAGHVTSAETAKSSAAGSASAAAASAAEAAAIAGMETVQAAVQTALDDRRWEARSWADMMQMRQLNNERFAASGMVHAGKHRDASGQWGEAINQGLWSYTAAPNNLMLGGDATNSAMSGLSKTGAAIAHIAGFTSKLVNINSTSIDASKIRFPESEKGCRVYDSATGVSVNYETDIDPKYGDVAPDLNEAVSRAWEGSACKNGDFRFGDDGTYDWGGASMSIANGKATCTTFTDGGSGNQFFTVPSPYKVFFEDAEYELTFDLELNGIPNVLIVNHRGDGTYETTYILADGTYTFKQQKSSTQTAGWIQLQTQNRTGGSFTVSNISCRKVTESVVLERVDVAALEFFLQKVTPERPFVFNKGMVQSAAADINGVSTEDTTYPDSYHACFPTDTESSKKGVNIYAKSVIEIDAMVSDPDNNIWWVREGNEFFWVQFCCRQRSFAGAGNGDWLQLNPANTESSGGFARFDNVAYGATSTRLIPQGIQDIPETNSGNWYYCAPYSTNIAKDKDIKGVFHARTYSAETHAFKGNCYLYILGHVPRLNQGCYHPQFNSLGSAGVWESGGFIAAWHESAGISALTDKRSCFDYSTDDATWEEGKICWGRWGANINAGAGASTRPDKRFYDAIYASGQSGFVDLRPKFGAWDASSAEQAAEVRAAVRSGEYRGVETLTRSQWVHADTVPEVTIASAWKDHNTSQQDISVDHSEGVDIGSWGSYSRFLYLVGDNGNTHLIERKSYWTHQHNSILSGAGSTTTFRIQALWGTRNAVRDDLNEKFPIGTKLKMYFLDEVDTSISVSGEFMQTDIIAKIGDILACDVLKNGWVGSWAGSNLDHPEFTRKNLGDISRHWLNPNTNTWSTYTTDVADTTLNRVNAGIPAGIWIFNYTAFAKQTKPCTSQPVLHGRAGVGDVYIAANNRVSNGGALHESLLDKVNTSNTYCPNLSLSAFELWENGVISTTSGVPTHSAITLPAPNNNSPAIKTLAYQIEANDQANLTFAFNELVWDYSLDNGAEFTDITEADTSTREAGKYYHVIDGDFRGFWKCLKSTTVALNHTEWSIFNDKLIRADGQAYYERWNGNGWGDSGKVVIADNTTTFSDDNGQTCLAGTAELALPYGYIKNNH